MELDDMKQIWATHTAVLERSLAINERVLRELILRKARFALVPYVIGRAVEVVIGLILLRLFVPVLARHITEPRYLTVAGAVVVFTGGLTWLCGYLGVGVVRLDYSAAVTAIRRDVERLKLVEYHATKWAVLGGVLLWLPVLLMLLEAISGFAALARVDLAWLLGNLAVGLAVFAAGQAWSRKYVERPDRQPRAQRIVHALSGWSLRRATTHLEELARFQRDELLP